jgi:perosamine synthetase
MFLTHTGVPIEDRSVGLVAGMSMMSGKSFPVGEGGMLVTEDDTVYQRAVAYGHYERTGAPSRFNPPDNQISDPDLLPYRGIPLGAFKHRMNQTCSAMGMSQLNRYPETINEIQKALNYFWDALSDVPGVRAHRPQTDSGSTMGGWYYPQGIYVQDEVFDTPLEVFCEAIRHEGFRGCYPGGNSPLHLHPFFHTADIFGMGKPTVVSFGQRDVRQGMGTLPVSERISQFVFTVPWFKHFDRSTIDRYVDVFRKVCFGAEQLVA